MNDGKIVFATLVATPTKTSWSQAYTAGKLYAVLSLEHAENEDRDLAAKGKEIIGALVEEYFTLEQKNLDSIKAAVIQTSKKIPADLHASFVVVSLVNNIVYAYTFGGGKILLKRSEKVGAILSTPLHEQHITVHAVSGYVENNDVLILETKQFSEIVQTNDFAQPFKDPADAVEMLSPKVHGKENGAASAIILSYAQEGAIPSLAFAPDTFDKPRHEEVREEHVRAVTPPAHPAMHSVSGQSVAAGEGVSEKETREERVEEIQAQEEPKRSALEEEFLPKTDIEPLPPLRPKKSFFPRINFKFLFKVVLFLIVPLCLLGVLGYTLYTTRLQQEENQIQQLFDQIYLQAQKEYEQGEALFSLNEQLAMDDFINAKKIIDANINKFPEGSPQRQKMEELLRKIEQRGVNSESSDTATPQMEAKVADAAASPLLTALSKNPKALYGTESNNTIYLGSNEDIQTGDGKVLIPNDTLWKKMAGLGVYNNNVYVLDKQANQILKFAGSSKDAKSVYTTGIFEFSVSMAIDSSIYVLETNGIIKKYTLGKQDSFTTTGITPPFSKPTRILTNAEMSSIYVLDTGNGRVVSLSKSGAFQKEYKAAVIKTAQDFDVDEAGKKLYILSNRVVHEINISN